MAYAYFETGGLKESDGITPAAGQYEVSVTYANRNDLLANKVDRASINSGNDVLGTRKTYYYAYVQDDVKATPQLTLNLGLRWDRQEIIDASGVTQITLRNDYAPRFGFAWDPTKDQKTKVYGSYGRYYEQLSMDLVIRSFSYERQPRIFNYSQTSTSPDPQAEADLGKPGASAILGGFTEPSDPNLRNQYLHEYILGAEREGLSADVQSICDYVVRIPTRFSVNLGVAGAYQPPVLPGKAFAQPDQEGDGLHLVERRKIAQKLAAIAEVADRDGSAKSEKSKREVSEHFAA